MSDDYTKQAMQAMAKAIDETINGTPLPAEKQFGFVLLIFAKDGETGNRTNYISNCERQDIVSALKEITGRFENRETFAIPAGLEAVRDASGRATGEVRPSVPVPKLQIDLVEYFERQITWSRETFGPALRTRGVIDHIRKELREIEQDPHDLSEWVDVVILAMDGFWRHGGQASDLLPALIAKQQKNMARTWPDWRTMSEDSAIEHDRSEEK